MTNPLPPEWNITLYAKLMIYSRRINYYNFSCLCRIGRRATLMALGS